MTEKLTTLEVDALTGIAVERELTSDEIADRNLALQQESERQSEIAAKADARASALAKLAALGLTEEEIAAL
jgi:DNA-binding NarL/FixJ family response regulator